MMSEIPGTWGNAHTVFAGKLSHACVLPCADLRGGKYLCSMPVMTPPASFFKNPTMVEVFWEAVTFTAVILPEYNVTAREEETEQEESGGRNTERLYVPARALNENWPR